MMYGGELIYPAYHASSGGRTEDSENYWTSYMPYLRSVEDPFVKGTVYEETVATLPWPRWPRPVGASLPASSDLPFIEVLSRFPSGRVA